MSNVDVSGVEACIEGLEVTIDGMFEAAVEAAEAIAERLETYAKQNHPWRNRSGDTEETTQAAVVDITEQFIVIALTTGTDYSLALELFRNGKWSWLWPAIEANQEEILTILRAKMESVRVV